MCVCMVHTCLCVAGYFYVCELKGYPEGEFVFFEGLSLAKLFLRIVVELFLVLTYLQDFCADYWTKSIIFKPPLKTIYLLEYWPINII